MTPISIIRKLLIIALLLTFVFPVIAQDTLDDTHPMLEMLSYVPDIPMASDELYYADIRTAVATRPGTPQFASLGEWNANEDTQRNWLQALPHTLPRFSQNLRVIIDDAGTTTGLDFFTIERTLAYGLPPSNGIILEGEFDPNAIAAAYQENGWVIERDTDDLTLLCSPEGCDDGLKINVDRRNPANPFGGDFGRVEPIALLDSLIFNSADFTTVRGLLTARAGDVRTLAEKPDVQAAVLVTAGQGAIRQAAFFAPETIGAIDARMLARGNLTPTEVEAALEPLVERLMLLPPYSLFMIAETADIEASIQTAHVVLVYRDSDSAQQAATALENNLQPDTIESARFGLPVREVIDERGMLQPVQIIEHAATERYVVLVSLQAPLVSANEQINGLPVMSGIPFRFFLDMVISLDTLWLATSLPFTD